MTAYSAYSDSQLISLLTQDDQNAFDALYTRHWASLYQSAFYLLRDRQACSDIVQDIFTWLWEHRQQLQIQTVTSYLKAAVKFKVANYIRSGRIRSNFFEDLAHVPVTGIDSAGDLAEINELQGIIRQAVNRLPGKCREIFRLSREEHLSNQQIADRLAISIKTVEAQMTIALKRIRMAVEPYVIAMLLMPALFHHS